MGLGDRGDGVVLQQTRSAPVLAKFHVGLRAERGVGGNSHSEDVLGIVD